ncbi:twin-arginine translocation signal domain-containing protein [Candidatus Roizmanbacteria bacterium]|nr:twin-arginine translocation signal domain-containing protein [Candidatus Roizmanbacteria bacterium]
MENRFLTRRDFLKGAAILTADSALAAVTSIAIAQQPEPDTVSYTNYLPHILVAPESPLPPEKITRSEFAQVAKSFLSELNVLSPDSGIFEVDRRFETFDGAEQIYKSMLKSLELVTSANKEAKRLMGSEYTSAFFEHVPTISIELSVELLGGAYTTIKRKADGKPDHIIVTVSSHESGSFLYSMGANETGHILFNWLTLYETDYPLTLVIGESASNAFEGYVLKNSQMGEERYRFDAQEAYDKFEDRMRKGWYRNITIDENKQAMNLLMGYLPPSVNVDNFKEHLGSIPVQELLDQLPDPDGHFKPLTSIIGCIAATKNNPEGKTFGQLEPPEELGRQFYDAVRTVQDRGEIVDSATSLELNKAYYVSAANGEGEQMVTYQNSEGETVTETGIIVETITAYVSPESTLYALSFPDSRDTLHNYYYAPAASSIIQDFPYTIVGYENDPFNGIFVPNRFLTELGLQFQQGDSFFFTTYLDAPEDTLQSNRLHWVPLTLSEWFHQNSGQPVASQSAIPKTVAPLAHPVRVVNEDSEPYIPDSYYRRTNLKLPANTTDENIQ